MDERTQVMMATLLGAAAGCVVGCLYLTERGRRVRTQLEPFFDSVIDEIHQAQHTVDKARLAAVEGRRAIDDVLRPSEGGASWESRDAGQPSPSRQAH